MSSNEGIIATNDDASNCKRFAVKVGYWSDPYIQYFVRSAERRPPEINRGYFTRTEAIKTLVQRFLQISQGKNCQIVNLGAGYDTLFWRLQEQGYFPHKYVEVDFPSVTSRKCHYIKNFKPLLEKVVSEDDEIRISSCELHSDRYHVVACDLKNTTGLETKLFTECNLDKSLPTVFISECVLVYVDVLDSGRLLNWISKTFSDVVFINYEQVNMDDRFGQVMISNLLQRQCVLAGVSVCKSLESQSQRFKDQSWDDAISLDMNTMYHKLPYKDIERIESLEFMDEKDIFEQLMRHYCITVAHKDSSNMNLKSVMF